MRGVKDAHAQPSSSADAAPELAAPADELTVVLREAVGELRAIRSALEKRASAPPEEPRHV
jgi:hypothetical protein